MRRTILLRGRAAGVFAGLRQIGARRPRQTAIVLTGIGQVGLETD